MRCRLRPPRAKVATTADGASSSRSGRSSHVAGLTWRSPTVSARPEAVAQGPAIRPRWNSPSDERVHTKVPSGSAAKRCDGAVRDVADADEVVGEADVGARPRRQIGSRARIGAR